MARGRRKAETVGLKQQLLDVSAAGVSASFSRSDPYIMDSTISAFDQFADTARSRIEHHLDAYSRFDTGCPDQLKAAIRHSLLAPGKRLRPILVLSAAEACGSDTSGAIPAACAIEMVHTYSLIHDDLPAMDDDDMRRGRPSCHAAFGEATAILAGDALLARAFEILVLDMEPNRASRCCAELAYAAGATQLVGGQADDLSSSLLPRDLPTLERIHRRKTGAILVAALRLGAIAANGTREQLNRLSAFGNRLGLAFQIVDDLLDRTGDEFAVGKRTHKDNNHGKLTFPSLLGIKESQRHASELIDEAIQQLDLFGTRTETLEALARFVLERNR